MRNSIDQSIRNLGNSDWYMRERAAAVLGEIKDRRAVQPLIYALKDPDWSVRLRAAESLGEIGDPDAIDPLIDVLEDDSQLVWRKAAWAVKKASMLYLKSYPHIICKKCFYASC